MTDFRALCAKLAEQLDGATDPYRGLQTLIWTAHSLPLPTTTRTMTAPTLREPVTPGDVLKEEFLDPMNITAYQLCKDTGLSQTQVSEIIKGKRAITDETDAALSKYFGLSRGYWRRMQVSYEQRKKARQTT
jgi:addiction module HigA family antidote